MLPVQIKLVMLTIDSKLTTPDFSYVHLLDIVCQTFLKFLTVNNLDGNASQWSLECVFLIIFYEGGPIASAS